MHGFFRIFVSTSLMATLLFCAEEKGDQGTIHYGTVSAIQDAGMYRYVQVDENGTKRWLAIAKAPVKVGDRIGFDTKTVMKDYTSKALGKHFKSVVFVNDLYLPDRTQAPAGTLKAFVLKNKPTTDKGDVKGFVEKDLYTVEEVHRWRKRLNGHRIKVKGKVYKVARDIMKRDWVHIGDGTGSEQKLTDDLVFTAQNVTLHSGDTVVAEGNVTVERNFGFGYFYDVLVEGARFNIEKNDAK